MLVECEEEHGGINEESLLPLEGSSTKFMTSEEVESSQMRLSLPTVDRECDRYGVSDRCAASLVSGCSILNE